MKPDKAATEFISAVEEVRTLVGDVAQDPSKRSAALARIGELMREADELALPYNARHELGQALMKLRDEPKAPAASKQADKLLNRALKELRKELH